MRVGVLVPAAVGAWIAAAGSTLMAPRSALLVALAAATAGMVSRSRRWLVVALLGVTLGATAAAWHVHGLRTGVVWALAKRHSEVDVRARLVRDPTPVTSASGSTMMVTDATVTAVREGEWRDTAAPVLIISFGGGWSGLLPGQQVQFSGRLSPPRRGDSVSAVIDAVDPPTLVGRPPWWQRLAGRVRHALDGACAALPADERGLVPGLVDGDVSAEPADLKNDMRLTGLTHLQAVSGENVSVVLAVAVAIARSIGLRRRSRIVLSTLALLGFVVLARPSPSVLRAAVMGAVVLTAMAVGRRTSALPALAAAVLLLVLVNPFLARTVGFVLSVCATGALVLIAPRWTERLSCRMPRPLAAAIAVPAAAQLVCTPVLILVFGQLTPYAVPANLLAAPAVAPATVLGVGAALLATVSAPPGAALAWLAAVPAAVIALVARVGVGLPGAGLRWSAGVGLCGLVALAVGLARWSWRRARRSAVTF
jgi:competence protein ComEC